MTKEEFNLIATNIIQQEQDLLRKKRAEYTQSDDVLDNFKRIALELDINSKKVWSVFFKKHIDSITNYVKTNITHTEPILGRIMDARNYLLLLAAMVQEESDSLRQEPHAMNWCQVGCNCGVDSTKAF